MVPSKLTIVLSSLALVAACSKSSSDGKQAESGDEQGQAQENGKKVAAGTATPLSGAWKQCEAYRVDVPFGEACKEMDDDYHLLFQNDGTFLDKGTHTCGKRDYEYGKGYIVQQRCGLIGPSSSRIRVELKEEGEFIRLHGLGSHRYYKRDNSADVLGSRPCAEFMTDFSCKEFPVFEPKVDERLVGAWQQCNGDNCERPLKSYYRLTADGTLTEINAAGGGDPWCTEWRVRAVGDQWQMAQCEPNRDVETVSYNKLLFDDAGFGLVKLVKGEETGQDRFIRASEAPTCSDKESYTDAICGGEPWHKNRHKK